MTRDEFLKTPSMPAFAPSYPHGPFRFVRREYLPVIITYERDPNAIRSYMTPIVVLGEQISSPTGHSQTGAMPHLNTDEPAPLEEAGLQLRRGSTAPG